MSRISKSKPKERLVRVVLKCTESGVDHLPTKYELMGVEQMPYLRTKREFAEYIRSKKTNRHQEDDIDSLDHGYDDLLDSEDDDNADEQFDEHGDSRKRRIAKKVDESDDASSDDFDEEDDAYDQDEDDEEDEDDTDDE